MSFEDIVSILKDYISIPAILNGILAAICFALVAWVWRLRGQLKKLRAITPRNPVSILSAAQQSRGVPGAPTYILRKLERRANDYFKSFWTYVEVIYKGTDNDVMTVRVLVSLRFSLLSPVYITNNYTLWANDLLDELQESALYRSGKVIKTYAHLAIDLELTLPGSSADLNDERNISDVYDFLSPNKECKPFPDNAVYPPPPDESD